MPARSIPWPRILAEGVAIVVSILLAFGIQASQVAAQTFGVQVSVAQDASVLYYGDAIDTQVGVGGRLELPLPGLFAIGPLARSRAVASLDRFFPDCDSLLGGASDCSYWELNANLAVPLTSGAAGLYLGGGLNVARSDVTVELPGSGPLSNAGTEIGLNLLGGFRFSLGVVSAFTEARLEVGGGEQFAVTGGVLIGDRGDSTAHCLPTSPIPPSRSIHSGRAAQSPFGT